MVIRIWMINQNMFERPRASQVTSNCLPERQTDVGRRRVWLWSGPSENRTIRNVFWPKLGGILRTLFYFASNSGTGAMIDLLGNKNTEFAAGNHCDRNCLKIKTDIIKINLCNRSRLCERVEKGQFRKTFELSRLIAAHCALQCLVFLLRWLWKLFSGAWRRVVWWKFTNFSEEPFVSSFRIKGWVSTLKMEAVGFSETSVNVYHSVRCHIREDSIFWSIRVANNYGLFLTAVFPRCHFLYINLGTECDGSIRIAGSSMASSFSVQVYPSCFPPSFYPLFFSSESALR